MLKIPRLPLKSKLFSHHAAKPLYLRRKISTTPKLHSARKLVHLKKLQADFQCEDGRPIYLKAGFMDRVLYTTTIILCFVGLANVFAVIYDHAKPASWKEKAC